VHRGQDQARYQLLSERLEQIIIELKDEWDQQLLAFQDLREDIMEDRRDNPHNLSPVESALFGLLLAELATSAEAIDDPRYVEASREIYLKAAQTIYIRDFWKKKQDVEDLRKEILVILVTHDLGDFHRLEQVADKARDVVQQNRADIPRA
jgi:type I restriction enzyme, R subunit